MKTLMRLAVVAVLTATAALATFAGTPGDVPYNRALAEQNLLIGVASDNLGLRLSAASILAEVGTSRSVISLMAMLHNGNEEERIVAALALSKIRDGRGEYAVKQAASFDPSPKVQRMAAWYYNEYAIPRVDSSSTTNFSMMTWLSHPAPYPENIDETEPMASGLSH